MTQQEFPPLQNSPKTDIYTKGQWEDIKIDIYSLTEQEGHFDPTKPLLGQRDDVVMYSTLEAAFSGPETIVALLHEGDRVVGYSMGVSIVKMDPGRLAEAAETAYIYYTIIHPEKRGQGLVGVLTDTLLGEMEKRRYRFVERDIVIENGYADAVERNYGSKEL